MSAANRSPFESKAHPVNDPLLLNVPLHLDPSGQSASFAHPDVFPSVQNVDELSGGMSPPRSEPGSAYGPGTYMVWPVKPPWRSHTATPTRGFFRGRRPPRLFWRGRVGL